MTDVKGKTTNVTIGNATVAVDCGYGSQYFNLHDQDMLPIVLEGARLVHEAATNFSKNSTTVANLDALYTAETSTYEIAHVLRTTYSHKVHVLLKDQRADLRPAVSISYNTATSTNPSSLFCDRRYIPDSATAASVIDVTTTSNVVCEMKPPMRVAFFDNVISSGGTIRAAVKLLRSQNIHVVVIFVLFVEGEAITELEVEPGFKLPVVSFGTLPEVRQHTASPTGVVPSTNVAPTQYRMYSDAFIPTAFGQVQFAVFTTKDGGQNAICVVGKNGDIGPNVVTHEKPLQVRIHDACMTSECFHSLKCDCREQLEMALQIVGEEGGMVIYLLQEGRGIGLAAKIAAYHLQQTQNLDTVDANRALGLPDDSRTYIAARDILFHFNIQRVTLMTNNPRKIEKLSELGVEIVGTKAVVVAPNSELCRKYMVAKAARMDHAITTEQLDAATNGAALAAAVKAQEQ